MDAATRAHLSFGVTMTQDIRDFFRNTQPISKKKKKKIDKKFGTYVVAKAGFQNDFFLSPLVTI